jgi:hypothetical protein
VFSGVSFFPGERGHLWTTLKCFDLKSARKIS